MLSRSLDALEPMLTSARCARAYVESCSITLEHMLTVDSSPKGCEKPLYVCAGLAQRPTLNAVAPETSTAPNSPATTRFKARACVSGERARAT